MIRKAFQRLATVVVCIGVIPLLAFWLPRHLWRQNWGTAVEQANLYHDQADRVVATNRSDFVGGAGGADEEFYTVDYRNYDANYDNGTSIFGSGNSLFESDEQKASNEEKPSGDQKFQVRTTPPCWTNMLKLANSMHRPRRFNDNFRKPEAPPPPILFIGNLETNSGQSRFVVVEVGQIRTKMFSDPELKSARLHAGEVRLSLNVWLLQLDKETCESSAGDNISCEVSGEFDEEVARTVELTSHKRNPGQRFPRFHLNFGPTATAFEIQLTDYDPASPPSIFSRSSIFSTDSNVVIDIVQIANESEPQP